MEIRRGFSNLQGRNKAKVRLLVFLLATACLPALPLPAEEEARYEFTEIAPPAGGRLLTFNAVYPFALFDSGCVLGFYQLSGVCRAFAWKKGVFTDLGLAPEASSLQVREIGSTGKFLGALNDMGRLHLLAWNNASYTEIPPPFGTTLRSVGLTDVGRIVGTLTTADGSIRIFEWFDGTFQTTSPPDGTTNLSITKVTPHGRILYEYYFGIVYPGSGNADNVYKGALTVFNGISTDLTPPGFDSAFAKLMLDSGLIAGIAQKHDPDSGGYAYSLFTWRNGVFSLTPVPAGYSNIEITAANDSGDLGGSAQSPDNSENSHAFVCSNGVFTELATNFGVRGISESGRAVGGGGSGSYPDGRGFTWFNGEFTDLTPQGATGSDASTISPDGRIIGTYLKNNELYGFTWFDGAFTELIPGGTTSSFSAIPSAITEDGIISGSYTDDAYYYSFIWEDGIFTIFTPPTFIKSINAAGEVLLAESANSRAWLAIKPGLVPTPPPKPPSASIMGKKSVTTLKAKLTIKGKTAGSVTEVAYRVGKGKWKKASGTAHWKISAKLEVGRNVIAIITRGPGGNSKPIKVTITRKKP